MSPLRHIRKGVLIRRNIASHLFTAVGCQQFRKESRKNIKRELCLNVIISFPTFSVVLAFRNVPKTVF